MKKRTVVWTTLTLIIVALSLVFPRKVVTQLQGIEVYLVGPQQVTCHINSCRRWSWIESEEESFSAFWVSAGETVFYQYLNESNDKIHLTPAQAVRLIEEARQFVEEAALNDELQIPLTMLAPEPSLRLPDWWPASDRWKVSEIK